MSLSQLRSLAIGEKIRPFCHLPGTTCIIPQSSWTVEAFPSLLRFRDLLSQQTREIHLDVQGPVPDFTLELDLEKGKVRLFGHTLTGYRQWMIWAEPTGICILSDQGKELIESSSFTPPLPLERLSLGMHRSLDWELVKRRRDLREIFPLWYHLGQKIPQLARPKHLTGFLSFLYPPSKLEIPQTYLNLFFSGFDGLMTPQERDKKHLAIFPEDLPPTTPSLLLLSEGRWAIRSFFFREEGENLFFLPSLPPLFHAGRLIGWRTSQGDQIDLEWSKKNLRRLFIRGGKGRTLTFHLDQGTRSFRVRNSPKDKGKRHDVMSPLRIEEGEFLCCDRFWR